MATVTNEKALRSFTSEFKAADRSVAKAAYVFDGGHRGAIVGLASDAGAVSVEPGAVFTPICATCRHGIGTSLRHAWRSPLRRTGGSHQGSTRSRSAA